MGRTNIDKCLSFQMPFLAASSLVLCSQNKQIPTLQRLLFQPNWPHKRGHSVGHCSFGVPKTETKIKKIPTTLDLYWSYHQFQQSVYKSFHQYFEESNFVWHTMHQCVDTPVKCKWEFHMDFKGKRGFSAIKIFSTGGFLQSSFFLNESFFEGAKYFLVEHNFVIAKLHNGERL